MSRISCQVMCSHILLIVFIWVNEFFDLVAMFGGQATPVNVFECLLESIIIFVLALANFFWFSRLEKKIRYLESFQVICAGCKKIKSDEKWVEIDKWLQNEKEVDFSHGFCEECFARLYPEFAELRKKKQKK